MAYLGIDYGTKRVGIAVSDDEAKLAFPLEVIAEKDALSRVAALVRERNVEVVVIGDSKDFFGQDNPVMKHIRAFAEELAAMTGVNVMFEPEFMTSQQAEREGGTSRENLDASAAALILQSFLDKLPAHG